MRDKISPETQNNAHPLLQLQFFPPKIEKHYSTQARSQNY